MKTDFIVSSLKETQEEDSNALKESQAEEKELCDSIAQGANEIAKECHDLKLIGNLVEVKENKVQEIIYKSPVYTFTIGLMLITAGFTSAYPEVGLVSACIGALSVGSSIAVNTELYPRITDEKRFFKRIETAMKLLSEKKSKIITRKQAMSVVLENKKTEESKKQEKLTSICQREHELETRLEEEERYLAAFESYVAENMVEMPDETKTVQDLVGKRLIKKESHRK